jgi:hypothetical protein
VSTPRATVGPVFLDEAWRAELRDRLSVDSEFRHVARWCDVAVQLGAPQGRATLAVVAGSLTDGVGAELPMVRVYAPAERWAAFFSPVPPAWHNDLLGLARRHDDVELDPGGDTLVRHLRALNRLWEVARGPR